ncbi:hypothetical protein AV530_012751 [Patagioenas fasciata monilis]|uniref:Uncharacterized protein n=1 Tax=Patagioenas fasciata monilis TaxID=372326 RepID=A0A1V4JC61_PATFA|nr:hypothetical protein AV530_012751 [Patagioenas fasciata monilis]
MRTLYNCKDETFRFFFGSLRKTCRNTNFYSEPNLTERRGCACHWVKSADEGYQAITYSSGVEEPLLLVLTGLSRTLESRVSASTAIDKSCPACLFSFVNCHTQLSHPSLLDTASPGLMAAGTTSKS